MNKIEYRVEHKDPPVFTPEVVIFDSPEEVDRYAASCLIKKIQEEKATALTLPTGTTPIGIYRQLVEAYSQGTVSFSKVRVFNLDEYWPIDPNNPSSYTSYMKQHFIDLVDIKRDSWDIPNGAAIDPNKESHRYEESLKAVPQIDIAVLGIGPGRTGHIGFNEKGSLVNSRTRYVELDPETATVNSNFFQIPQDIPRGAITQGIANILEAKNILLVAKGQSKTWGISRSLNGPIYSDCPASYLRYHPNVVIVLDRQAATSLG